LEVVHTYLCGPTRTKGLDGEQYFMLLVDDYIRMNWVFFLKRSQNILKFSEYSRNLLKMKPIFLIKFLRSYNGGEITSMNSIKILKNME